MELVTVYELSIPLIHALYYFVIKSVNFLVSSPVFQTFVVFQQPLGFLMASQPLDLGFLPFVSSIISGLCDSVFCLTLLYT